MTEETTTVYINDYTGETFEDYDECDVSEREYLFGVINPFFAVDEEGQSNSINSAIDEYEDTLLNPHYASVLVFGNLDTAIDFHKNWLKYWDKYDSNEIALFSELELRNTISDNSPVILIRSPFSGDEYPYILKQKAEKIMKKIQNNLLSVKKLYNK